MWSVLNSGSTYDILTLHLFESGMHSVEIVLHILSFDLFQVTDMQYNYLVMLGSGNHHSSQAALNREAKQLTHLQPF